MANASTRAAVLVAERIIYDHFGEAVGQVGAVMLQRGRISIAQLGRLVPDLDKRTILKCLLVLMQHNCCRHNDVVKIAKALADGEKDDSDDEESAPAVTSLDEHQLYFEIDADAVIARLRFGRFLGQVAQMIGPKQAGTSQAPLLIMEHVLRHGKATIGELVDLCATHPGEVRKTWVNNLERLVTHHSFLMPVTLKSHVIEADADEFEEREHFKKSGKKTGAIPVKELAAFRNQLRAKKRRVQNGAPDSDDEASYSGLGKRKRSVAEAKVLQSSETYADSSQRKQAEDSTTLPLDMIVRANYERFYIRWRNDLVRSAVRERHGMIAAQLVYGLLTATEQEHLSSLEARSPRVRTQDIQKFMLPQKAREPSSSGHNDAVAKLKNDLLAAFNHDVPISQDERHDGSASGPRSAWEASRMSASDFISELCAIMSRPQGSGGRRSESSQPWMSYAEVDGGEPAWQLDFGAIFGTIRQQMFEGTVRHLCASGGTPVKDGATETEKMEHAADRFTDGLNAVRVINLLERNGKMEEKTVSKIAMLTHKATRTVLGRLQESSFLELQEVSRSKTDKSRSIYLWYADPEKWQAALLALSHQSLGNLLTRREVQETKLREEEERLRLADMTIAPGAAVEPDHIKYAKRNALKARLLTVDVSIGRLDEDRFILALPGPFTPHD